MSLGKSYGALGLWKGLKLATLATRWAGTYGPRDSVPDEGANPDVIMDKRSELFSGGSRTKTPHAKSQPLPGESKSVNFSNTDGVPSSEEDFQDPQPQAVCPGGLGPKGSRG